MIARARARLAWVLLAAGGLIAGWMVWVGEVHTQWEDIAHYRMMEWQGAGPARESGLVQIKIQDLSDEAWPWPHLDYAILLHALAPFQPEVLALDLPLEYPDTLHPVYERQLSRQMKSFRDVVLAAKPSLETRPNQVPPGVEPLSESGISFRLPFAGSARWPIESYQGNNRISLSATTGVESGRVPLIFRLGRSLVPAFPLVIYGKSIGVYWPHCEWQPGEDIILRDYQKAVLARIPVDIQGRLRMVPSRLLPPPLEVEFYTAVLSAEQIHNEARPLFDLNKMRRQLVLVSMEHPDTVTPVVTPDGMAYPGGIQAHVLQQLLLRETREFAPPLVGFVLLLAAAVMATWAGQLDQTLQALLGLGGLLFFLALDSAFSLFVLKMTLPLGAVLTAIASSWLLAFTWRGLLDWDASKNTTPDVQST
ncbi:MAG: CHASE2 domain-containing protein [Candidatus Methylacidiphilales bacterium]|nr:CHASE2 domain-containing protein [Candidatus Methylacidiphilales bacterium]